MSAAVETKDDGAAVGLEMETIGSAASSDYTPPEITTAASDAGL